MLLDQLVNDLREAACGMVDQAMVDRGANWIKAMRREFPLAHRLLMNTLYDTPESVLDTVARMNTDLKPIRRNPHAIKYVRLLQEKLRGRDDKG